MITDENFVSCIVSELEQIYSNSENELRNFVVDNYQTFYDDFWHEWYRYCVHSQQYGISGDTSAKETFYNVLSRIIVNVKWPTYGDGAEFYENFVKNLNVQSKEKFGLNMRSDHL